LIDISSDELDEELMRELSEGLDDLDLARKFCCSPLLDERCQSGVKVKKEKAKVVTGTEFHLDDWIHLKMDNEAAHHLFSLRQKWQVIQLSSAPNLFLPRMMCELLLLFFFLVH
jgi:hypothetical protein